MNAENIEMLKSGRHLIVKISTGEELEIGMHAASMGVRFVAVYRNGRRVRSTQRAQASVMFGSWTCANWLDHMEFVRVEE